MQSAFKNKILNAFILFLFVVLFPIFCYASINEGLVGWWKLNESSGNAIDSSGYGNTGTLIGPNGLPVWTSNCKRSGCLQLDGVDDYASTTLSIIGYTTWSMSFWMKKFDTSSYMYVSGDNGTDWVGIGFHINGNLYFTPTINTNKWGYYAYPNDTNWHHVVMVYNPNGITDADKLKGYLDGVAVVLSISGAGSWGSSVPAGMSNIKIGLLLGIYSKGVIDDVRIYNRSLTAQEVRNLYHSPVVINGAVINNATLN